MMKHVLCTVVALVFCSSAAADPADVFDQLWPNQVYVEGTTAMILTPLGDPSLDVWTVELVDTQDINNPIVLSEATLTVDTRFTFLRYDPSATELEQAGINVMQTETIAAFFNSPAVGSIVLYGYTQHTEIPPFVEGDPPVVFDGLGVLGIASDLATAITEAADLSTAILPDPNPIPKPDKTGILESDWTYLIQDIAVTDSNDNISTETDIDTGQPLLAEESVCYKEFLGCINVACHRQSAAISSCSSDAWRDSTTCIPKSAVCLIGAPVCFAYCMTAVVGAEDSCIISAKHSWRADATICNNNFNACCLENYCPPGE